MELNPYAAPESESLQPSPGGHAEEIRRAHLNTEAAIKSVGTLYCFGAFVLTLFCGAGLLNSSPAPDSLSKPALGALIVLALAQGWVGLGLRKLASWARIPTIILSLLGLLAFPVGTLINLYILFKVAGKKGTMVFSQEYREVIAATPHIKRKTSIIVWVLLAILVLALIGIIVNLSRGY